MNETPSPLALFEQLCALDSAPAGAWLDCATQLEIAADKARFAGQPASQVQRLRDRADECRRNASREASTKRIPRSWANWCAEVRLAPVVMPVARDRELASALTQPMPLVGGAR